MAAKQDAAATKEAPPSAGVRIAAPAGMEAISVGGIEFRRSDDGYFVLPAQLVNAAVVHIAAFKDAAQRDARRIADDAARLVREADLPGRIRKLEERLAAMEATLGITRRG